MTYDLESVSLPRLGTTSLRVLVALLENRATGPALIERLKRIGGLTRLRELVISESPTFLPLLPAGDSPSPPRASAREDPPPKTAAFRFPGMDAYTTAYRTGRVTPEQIAERFVAQHGKSESDAPPLRAFIAVHHEDLMTQARASSERWRAGRPLGAFDGVPVAIKDELDQAGYPTTVGTRFLGVAPATEDATVVSRLRAAGAMLVGKANMHEIGINVTGLNPHHGTTRNPYHDGYHTGGSSSGPATAVASGLVPLAIGADGGGSIRIPSAFCGLVGMKATFGRVSESGAAPLCWSVAHIGPIAATAADCARAHALIAGPDPRDANTWNHPPVDVDGTAPASLAGLRLGVYWPWFRHATPEVVERCEWLLGELVAHGATLREVEIPELDLMRVAHVATITGEMAAAMASHYRTHRRDFSIDARANLAIARSFNSSEYLTAQRVRTRAIGAFQRVLLVVDAIVTPATGQTAPRINPAAQPSGESDLSMTTEVMRFAFPANLTGHPAISFPAGYDASGLPIGLQVIGRAWGERELVRLAAVAETVVERRMPQRWYPLLGEPGS
jgi:Asp-tRNA(Asn)/Glu-tRNA(Gln) amidotransferase A subunit family amidase